MRNMQTERRARDGKIQVRAVVFDYGKVLCHPQHPSDLESMARICGMAVSRFQELYWKFRLRYDRSDLNGDSYWATVAREDGKVFAQQQIAELVTLDSKSWSRRNKATLEWVGTATPQRAAPGSFVQYAPRDQPLPHCPL